VALALGLAFGLGGRETAAMIVRDWYSGAQSARPAMQAAAEALPRKAADRAESGSTTTTTTTTAAASRPLEATSEPSTRARDGR